MKSVVIGIGFRMKSFGEFLVQEIDVKRTNTFRLAKRMGTDPSFFSRLKSQRDKSMRLATFIKMAKALDMTPTQLMMRYEDYLK